MSLGKVLPLLALISLLPALPFALVGYVAHDVQFHLVSWMELRDAWFSGKPWLGWDALSNFTLGDPHFCFYPPVSEIVGACLAAILPLRIVSGAYVSLCFFLSGWAMYLASGEFVPENDRFKAAVLYMVSPYLWLTGLARFAAAELLVQALLPLICLLFYRALWRQDRRALALLAALLGLDWLTNVPASIVLFYGLSTAAIAVCWRLRKIQPLLQFWLAEGAAVLLAAFYLVPAWSEQKWISPGKLFIFNLREFMLFAPVSMLTRRTFSISCSTIGLVGFVLVAVCLWPRKGKRPEADTIWWAMALVAFCLQIPITAWLWLHLPELLAVQFSYRFSMLLGVVLPFALFALPSPKYLRIPVYVATAALSLLVVQIVVHSRSDRTHFPLFDDFRNQWAQRGKIGMPEYLPEGLVRYKTPTGLPAISLAGNTAASDCSAIAQMQGPSVIGAEVRATAPCLLRFRTYYYPYWHAISASGEELTAGRGSDGLLVVSVPPGSTQVRLEFEEKSSLRTITLWLSAAVALILAWATVLLTRRQEKVANIS